MGEQTVATLSHFILAMVQHPWMLKRAQAEIDAAVGQNRLPVLDDRPSLPYCNAIFTETLRWSVGVPLGVYPPVSSILMLTRVVGLPHRLMEDDVYNGVFIPKGSLVRRPILLFACIVFIRLARCLQISGACETGCMCAQV